MGDAHNIQSNETESDPRLERRERLTYLADLLNELQVLAQREGCETLTGLLALSHAEALRKASL